MATAAAVIACFAATAACAGRAVRPTWDAVDGPEIAESDETPIDELVARPPELAPRRAVIAPPTTPTVTLPRAPTVLPLVRPRAGGDALALADLAMARNDPFDAAAQYRDILARRPTYAAYVQFRLAQTYIALGESHRAVPLLRAAAAAPAPEGWAALTLLAELRAARIGAVDAVAELRVLAGPRVPELEAYLVNVVPPADAAPLLMQMALESPSAVACDLALSAIALGHRDYPRELDVSCKDDADRALAAATGGTIVDRTLTFEWQFNDAANTWQRLVERAAAGDRDGVPWLALADQYLNARTQAVHERQKNLASYGAYAALSIAVDLLERTGQTRGVSADHLRNIASDLDPRFSVTLPPELLRRLGDPQPGAP